MLVLARRTGERLVIGEGPSAIVVTVVGSSLGKVKLGVEAPEDVKVVRGELLDVVQASRERFNGESK
jgi:carbon storage regulator